jgi:HEAT repeat protein
MAKPTIASLLHDINSLPPSERLGAAELLVSHPDPSYRMRALEVAFTVGHNSIGAFCLRLLNDPVWYVRCSACEFAYLRSIKESAEAAIDLLENDPEETVRSYAALSLAHTGRVEHLPHLEGLVGRVTGFNHEDVPISNILQRSIDRIRSGDTQE